MSAALGEAQAATPEAPGETQTDTPEAPEIIQAAPADISADHSAALPADRIIMC